MSQIISTSVSDKDKDCSMTCPVEVDQLEHFYLPKPRFQVFVLLSLVNGTLASKPDAAAKIFHEAGYIPGGHWAPHGRNRDGLIGGHLEGGPWAPLGTHSNSLFAGHLIGSALTNKEGMVANNLKQHKVPAFGQVKRRDVSSGDAAVDLMSQAVKLMQSENHVEGGPWAPLGRHSNSLFAGHLIGSALTNKPDGGAKMLPSESHVEEGHWASLRTSRNGLPAGHHVDVKPHEVEHEKKHSMHTSALDLQWREEVENKRMRPMLAPLVDIDNKEGMVADNLKQHKVPAFGQVKRRDVSSGDSAVDLMSQAVKLMQSENEKKQAILMSTQIVQQQKEADVNALRQHNVSAQKKEIAVSSGGHANIQEGDALDLQWREELENKRIRPKLAQLVDSDNKEEMVADNLKQHKVPAFGQVKRRHVSSGDSAVDLMSQAVKLMQSENEKKQAMLTSTLIVQQQKEADANALRQHNVSAQKKEIAVSSGGHAKTQEGDANRMVRRVSPPKTTSRLTQVNADEAVDLMNQAVKRVSPAKTTSRLAQVNTDEAVDLMNEAVKRMLEEDEKSQASLTSALDVQEHKETVNALRRHKVSTQMKEIPISSGVNAKMQRVDAENLARRAIPAKNKARLAQVNADEAVDLMNQAVKRMIAAGVQEPTTAAPAATTVAATTAPATTGAAAAAATTALATTVPPTTGTGWMDELPGPPSVLPTKPILPPGAWAAMSIGFVGLVVLVIGMVALKAIKPQGRGDARDNEDCNVDNMDEDCYGMALAALIRDSQRAGDAAGASFKMLRVARIVMSFFLLALIMTIQVFLLIEIKKFGCAEAVHDIREVYDDFEQKMYQGHVTWTVNGKARGVEGFFDSSRFNELTEDEKDVVCKIPFSQPRFLGVILLVWTLTVVGEIKAAVLIFERLVIQTETAGSMVNATEETDDGNVIFRLTAPIKAVITIVIVVPRILIAGFLLWMGCRWLSATTDFGDLVLNASALEFVLLTKDLLYSAMVPNRSKREVMNLKISLKHESGPPTIGSFLGSFLWGVAALCWTLTYMYQLQAVLPDYKYDIHDVCLSYIKERYA